MTDDTCYFNYDNGRTSIGVSCTGGTTGQMTYVCPTGDSFNPWLSKSGTTDTVACPLISCNPNCALQAAGTVNAGCLNGGLLQQGQGSPNYCGVTEAYCGMCSGGYVWDDRWLFDDGHNCVNATCALAGGDGCTAAVGGGETELMGYCAGSPVCVDCGSGYSWVSEEVACVNNCMGACGGAQAGTIYAGCQSSMPANSGEPMTICSGGAGCNNVGGQYCYECIAGFQYDGDRDCCMPAQGRRVRRPRVRVTRSVVQVRIVLITKKVLVQWYQEIGIAVQTENSGILI